MYPLLTCNLKLLITGAEIDPETQNQLPTLKPGDTIRKRTDEGKTGDKKESVIVQNDYPCLYNVINEKGNLIIRNHYHLIATNKKFIFKHYYESIIEPSKTTSQKLLYNQELTYLQILPHHQLQQNLDIGNQRGI